VSEKPKELEAIFLIEILLFEGTYQACWTSLNPEFFWTERAADDARKFLLDKLPGATLRVKQYTPFEKAPDESPSQVTHSEA
jgi:hypothetical protein